MFCHFSCFFAEFFHFLIFCWIFPFILRLSGPGCPRGSLLATGCLPFFFDIIPILICYHFPPFLNILFHFFLYSCIPVFIYIIFLCIFLCISWTGFVFSSTSIPSVSFEYSCYVLCWLKLFVFQNYFSQYSQLFYLKLTYFLKVS